MGLFELQKKILMKRAELAKKSLKRKNELDKIKLSILKTKLAKKKITDSLSPEEKVALMKQKEKVKARNQKILKNTKKIGKFIGSEITNAARNIRKAQEMEERKRKLEKKKASKKFIRLRSTKKKTTKKRRKRRSY